MIKNLLELFILIGLAKASNLKAVLPRLKGIAIQYKIQEALAKIYLVY